jgi:hypothetical protein
MPAFSMFIHNAKSTTPTLLMEVASDWRELRILAERALADSKDRLAVEVRHDDRLVFTLDRNGTSWASDRL